MWSSISLAKGVLPKTQLFKGLTQSLIHPREVPSLHLLSAIIYDMTGFRVPAISPQNALFCYPKVYTHRNYTIVTSNSVAGGHAIPSLMLIYRKIRAERYVCIDLFIVYPRIRIKFSAEFK